MWFSCTQDALTYRENIQKRRDHQSLLHTYTHTKSLCGNQIGSSGQRRSWHSATIKHSGREWRVSGCQKQAGTASEREVLRLNPQLDSFFLVAVEGKLIWLRSASRLEHAVFRGPQRWWELFASVLHTTFFYQTFSRFLSKPGLVRLLGKEKQIFAVK